jgi:hypothetical protein
MATINTKRVVIGGLVGGVAWLIWGSVLNVAVMMPRYQAAAALGTVLKEPRYPFFVGAWAVMVLLLGLVAAWLYANVRATMGPGPGTAAKLGLVLGFVAGFPANYYTATWLTVSRTVPLGWVAELWVGMVLATFVAAWLYRES